MKRNLLLLKLIVIIVLLSTRCEKNEVPDNKPFNSEVEKDVYLKNDRLVFKNKEVFEDLKKVLSNMSDEEYKIWTTSMKFESFQNTFESIYNRIDSLINSNDTLKAKRIYDSMRDFPPSINRTINKNGILQIGKKVFIFKNKRQYCIDNCEPNQLQKAVNKINKNLISDDDVIVKVTKIERNTITAYSEATEKLRQNHQYQFNPKTDWKYKFVFECDSYYGSRLNPDPDIAYSGSIVIRNKFEVNDRRKWWKWNNAGEPWTKEADLTVQALVTIDNENGYWQPAGSVNYSITGSGNKDVECFPNLAAYVAGFSVSGYMYAGTDNTGKWSYYSFSKNQTRLFYKTN